MEYLYARGVFDVKLRSLEPYKPVEQMTLNRMSLEKEFHGDLEAKSEGEMLSTGSPKESGGYVAMERVVGTLCGRRGTFALQHNATMTNGVPYLNIIVVPGSGTEELTGLSGRLTIMISDGKHTYDLEYSIPD